MPELPEVEFCARHVRAGAVGRRITAVEATIGPPLEGPPAAFAAATTGRSVQAVRRVGKQLIVDLDIGHVLLHLGMTGKILRHPIAQPPRPATRLMFTLDDGHRLDFVDSRRFGRVAAVDAAALAEHLDRLGPDALEITADPPAMAARFQGVRQAIKVALLDQSRIAGVGNIYAAEALFLARLHPWTLAGALPVAAWAPLSAGLAETMNASLQRELGEEIIYLQEGAESPFLVYGREGAPCTRCGTAIVRTVQQARSTFWCPTCQPA